MVEWIAIIIAVIGPIVLHFVREGYMRRQLEDIEKQITKGFEYDKIHFAHAERSDIHQPAMPREVSEARYDVMDQKFNNLNDKIDTLTENNNKTDAKIELVRKSVHDLRADVPHWIEKAAERAAVVMKELYGRNV